MPISSSSWQILAANVPHKKQLIAYAALRGVPVAPAAWGHATDEDLFLSWLSDTAGIISLPERLRPERATVLIDEVTFRVLADEYQEERQQALVQPHHFSEIE